jgi:hypothetical protein
MLASDGQLSPFRVYHELLQRYAPPETGNCATGLIIAPETMPRDEWEEFMESMTEERARKKAAAAPNSAPDNS